MARVINGVNGLFIGKVGSVIGYVANGRNFAKGAYKKRTGDAKPGEVINRTKFAASQNWLSPLNIFLKAGFKDYRPTFQGFQGAKSWMMLNAMTTVDGEIAVDPSMVKISSGPLILPPGIGCTFEAPNTFRFVWEPSDRAAYETQQVMACVYNVNKKLVYGPVFGNGKSIGEQLVLVDMEKGSAFHCYLAFTTTDRTAQSDSVYLGAWGFEGEH